LRFWDDSSSAELANPTGNLGLPVAEYSNNLVLGKVTKVQLDDLLLDGDRHSKNHRQANFAECSAT
jgi:hypothetical protein